MALTKVKGAVWDGIDNGRIVSALDIGAKGDGVTDDIAYLQGAVDDLHGGGGGTLFFPKTADYYRITKGLVQRNYVNLVGEGYASHIRNDSGLQGWGGTVLWAGTYFGHVSTVPDGALKETAYNLYAIAAGSREVTLETPAQDVNFTVGDVVFLTDQHKLGSGDMERYAMVNEVVAVSSGVITLKYLVPDNYTADGANKVQIRVATETIAIEASKQNYMATTNEKARILRNANVEGLRLTHALQNDSQMIHVSSYECSFQKLWCEGTGGWGLNPCAFTEFRGIWNQFAQRPFELAHFSNDVNIDGWFSNRIGDNGTTSGYQFGFTFNETGSDINVTNFVIRDYFWTGGPSNPAIQVQKRRVSLSNGRVIGAQGAGVAFASESADNLTSEGSSISNTTIIAPKDNGIRIKGDGISVVNCIIKGINSGRYGMLIDAGVQDCRIIGNRLGATNNRAPEDIIFCTDGYNTNNVFEGNSTYLTQQTTRRHLIAAKTDASTSVIVSYPITADRSSLLAGFDVKVLANVTAASTNGQKDINLYLCDTSGGGGTEISLGSITMAAGTTGPVEILAEVRKVSETAQNAYSKVIDASSVALARVAGTFNMTTTTLYIELRATLASASDTIQFHTFEVIPSNDQIQTT